MTTVAEFAESGAITLGLAGTAVTCNGDLSVKGNTTLGDASSDTVTCNGPISMNGPAVFGNRSAKKIITSAKGDTTPSVAGGDILVLPAADADYTITNFKDGVNGQTVTVVNDSGKDVTIEANANIRPYDNSSPVIKGGTISFVRVNNKWRARSSQTL